MSQILNQTRTRDIKVSGFMATINKNITILMDKRKNIKLKTIMDFFAFIVNWLADNILRTHTNTLKNPQN